MNKDFLEHFKKEQEILDISFKQSKVNKKERQHKEKKEKSLSEKLQDELEPIYE